MKVPNISNVQNKANAINAKIQALNEQVKKGEEKANTLATEYQQQQEKAKFSFTKKPSKLTGIVKKKTEQKAKEFYDTVSETEQLYSSEKAGIEKQIAELEAEQTILNQEVDAYNHFMQKELDRGIAKGYHQSNEWEFSDTGWRQLDKDEMFSRAVTRRDERKAEKAMNKSNAGKKSAYIRKWEAEHPGPTFQKITPQSSTTGTLTGVDGGSSKTPSSLSTLQNLKMQQWFEKKYPNTGKYDSAIHQMMMEKELAKLENAKPGKGIWDQVGGWDENIKQTAVNLSQSKNPGDQFIGNVGGFGYGAASSVVGGAGHAVLHTAEPTYLAVTGQPQKYGSVQQWLYDNPIVGTPYQSGKIVVAASGIPAIIGSQYGQHEAQQWLAANRKKWAERPAQFWGEQAALFGTAAYGAKGTGKTSNVAKATDTFRKNFETKISEARWEDAISKIEETRKAEAGKPTTFMESLGPLKKVKKQLKPDTTQASLDTQWAIREADLYKMKREVELKQKELSEKPLDSYLNKDQKMYYDTVREMRSPEAKTIEQSVWKQKKAELDAFEKKLYDQAREKARIDWELERQKIVTERTPTHTETAIQKQLNEITRKDSMKRFQEAQKKLKEKEVPKTEAKNVVEVPQADGTVMQMVQETPGDVATRIDANLRTHGFVRPSSKVETTRTYLGGKRPRTRVNFEEEFGYKMVPEELAGRASILENLKAIKPEYASAVAVIPQMGLASATGTQQKMMPGVISIQGQSMEPVQGLKEDEEEIQDIITIPAEDVPTVPTTVVITQTPRVPKFNQREGLKTKVPGPEGPSFLELTSVPPETPTRRRVSNDGKRTTFGFGYSPDYYYPDGRQRMDGETFENEWQALEKGAYFTDKEDATQFDVKRRYGPMSTKRYPGDLRKFYKSHGRIIERRKHHWDKKGEKDSFIKMLKVVRGQ